MARTAKRKPTNSRKPPAGHKSRQSTGSQRPSIGTNHSDGNFFSLFASKIAHFAGRPLTFLLAVAAVLIWGASGPIFGFSDTWQLVINTSTTIITFLMVFLIQNTQNRDTLALQLKVSELIFVMHGAENKMAAAEDLSDDDLEKLHAQFRERADHTLAVLKVRRKPQDE